MMMTVRAYIVALVVSFSIVTVESDIADDRRRLFPYCWLYRDSCIEISTSSWDLVPCSSDNQNEGDSNLIGEKAITSLKQSNEKRDGAENEASPFRCLNSLKEPVVFPAFDTPYHRDMKLANKNYSYDQFIDEFKEKGLEFVQISKQKNILYFFPDMPFNHLINKRYPGSIKPCFVHMNMTSDQFKAKLNKKGDDEYVYYSDQMAKNVIPKSIENDILPYVKSFFPYYDESKIQTNVWIGKSGSTARLHFDAHDNFYIQVFGKKRITLIEPSAWFDLRLYPKLHPSDRQSQINETELKILLSETDPIELNSSCLSSSSGSILMPLSFDHPEKYNHTYKVFVTELQAGQVLFMPKYYFHSIEAVENSVNVNIWAPSSEVLIGRELYDNAMPFVDHPMWQSSDELLDLAAFYLATHTLKLMNYSSEFVDKIVESSYSPLRDVLDTIEHPKFSVKKLPDLYLKQVIGHAEVLAAKMKDVKFKPALDIITSNFLQGLGHWTQSTIGFLEALSKELRL